MLLEFLQHALGIQPRIGIIQPGDKAQRNYIVLRPVNPGSAIFLRRQRPAHCVNDFTCRHAPCGNFPEFLDAHAVSLWIGIFREIEFRYELFH